MASTRQSTSRYSLDDWDTLAPLSSTEHLSISRLTQATAVPSVPDHLKKQSPLPRLPTTFDNLNNNSNGSARSTPRPSSAFAHRPVQGGAGQNEGDMDPLALLASLSPISTQQQFHDFHALVEQSLERHAESTYHSHLDTLSHHITTTSHLLENLDESRALLSELHANESYVAENSSALQHACETMLDEQKHLLEVAEALTARLEYFRELERAVRLLNEPGEEVVLRPEFLEALDRLGVCLEYLRANRDFVDSPLYLIRFQQCLTRSMTLIKMYFISVMKRTGEEVRTKLHGKELSEPALNALLYSKFSSLSPTLRLLLRELESRCYVSSPSSSHQPSLPNPSDISESYLPLLLDCQTSYFSLRQALLSPLLAEEVRRMEPGKAELVGLAKTGCGYMRGVCEAEWGLAGEFFGARGERGEGGEGEEIYRFLSTLLDHLTDSLRPRILHEPSLATLCDLCGVLSGMMALDTDPGLAAAAETGEEDEDLLVSPASPGVSPGLAGGSGLSTRRGSFATLGGGSGLPRFGSASGGGGAGGGGTSLGRLRFAYLLAPILQDAQTRLVFRAQAVVQSEVLHYVPGGGELEKWSKAGGGGEKEGEGEDEREEYKTVGTTRGVLERLERCVNNAIFLDFTAEAISLCRTSLSVASSALASLPPTESISTQDRKADAQLFLIRHLLVLKEMVGGVELVRRERGVELGEALASLLRAPLPALRGFTGNVLTLNARGLFDSMPNLGAEVMVDAKVELDTALKLACEDLITHSSLSLTSSLRTFLDRCTSFLSSPSSSTTSAPPSLADQPWATPAAVLSLSEDFERAAEKGVKEAARRMRGWLREEKTVRVLVPPMLEELGEVYGTFFNLIRSEYGFATSSSLKPPAELGEKLKAAAARE